MYSFYFRLFLFSFKMSVKKVKNIWNYWAYPFYVHLHKKQYAYTWNILHLIKVQFIICSNWHKKPVYRKESMKIKLNYHKFCETKVNVRIVYHKQFYIQSIFGNRQTFWNTKSLHPLHPLEFAVFYVIRNLG